MSLTTLNCKESLELCKIQSFLCLAVCQWCWHFPHLLVIVPDPTYWFNLCSAPVLGSIFSPNLSFSYLCPGLPWLCWIHILSHILPQIIELLLLLFLSLCLPVSLCLLLTLHAGSLMSECGVGVCEFFSNLSLFLQLYHCFTVDYKGKCVVTWHGFLAGIEMPSCPGLWDMKSGGASTKLHGGAVGVGATHTQTHTRAVGQLGREPGKLRFRMFWQQCMTWLHGERQENGTAVGNGDQRPWSPLCFANWSPCPTSPPVQEARPSFQVLPPWACQRSCSESLLRHP